MFKKNKEEEKSLADIIADVMGEAADEETIKLIKVVTSIWSKLLGRIKSFSYTITFKE